MIVLSSIMKRSLHNGFLTVSDSKVRVTFRSRIEINISSYRKPAKKSRGNYVKKYARFKKAK